jgi:hypothetical protein
MTTRTGQATAGASQRATSSLMERLQKEEDPELAELIRTAVANHKGAGEQEIREITRRVTQSHAQILLLDLQIAEVDRKIEATPGTQEETRRQLLQTRKELEAKRRTEMGSLREATGITPRAPFGTQPTETLNARVGLQAFEQQVLVLDALKPLSSYWALARYAVVGLVPENEALDYVRGRLKDKRSLPLRIDVYYRSGETSDAAQRLHDKIAALARETNTDMHIELRLLPVDNWAGSGQSTFYLREGKIRTFHADPVRRPDGGPDLLLAGVVEVNDLEQHILWRLLHPGNLPFTFRIEYDDASSELARQVADTAKAVVKRLGLTELVGVTGALVEPVPETVFLGRWQAVTSGAMQTIDIQPRGACLVTMDKGTSAIKAAAIVPGIWLPTTKEIIVDIKDKVWGKTHYVYRASVSAEGNLVVERGGIYHQGSFENSDLERVIFQKVQ